MPAEIVCAGCGARVPAGPNGEKPATWLERRDRLPLARAARRQAERRGALTVTVVHACSTTCARQADEHAGRVFRLVDGTHREGFDDEAG